MGTELAAKSGAQKAERVVKKRASQACHHCRVRKVKCDLVKSGVPCHKCESERIECVVIESRRTRKHRLERRKLSGLVSLPPLVQAQPRSTDTAEPSPSAAANDQGVNHNIIEQQQQHQDTPEASSISNPNIQSPGVCSDHNSARLSEQYARPKSPGETQNERPFTLDLPSHIRPIRATMKSDDIELLARRGALTLPCIDLRDQLLRCFVLYVYPYMPIVDLEDLFNALDGKDEAPKISLTLFQAIMFAGTAFVDLQLLLDEGHENRRAARGEYYRKLKLLYDFDWDVDRIPLIQSLLLANSWYVSENDQKNPWYWIGVCVSIATSIGVNQVITYNDRNPQTRRLWRRIWWSCIMRDRIISASHRRPIRIEDEDINLSPLTLSDFDLGPITTSIPVLQDCPVLKNSTVRQNLAEMCIAHVSILLCMGHIVQSLYHLRVFGGSTNEPTMLYKPRTSQINLEEVFVLQDQLDQWYQTLPVSCWLSPGVNATYYDKTTEDLLFLHKSVLRMIYLMAIEHLNRPQMLLKTMSTDPTSKVQEAAERIAEIFQRLQERNLIRLLPMLSVGLILFSLPAFLVKIKSKGQNVRNLPGQQFHCCVRALWQLRDTWPIADYVCFLIGQMICQIGGVPTPGVQPVAVSNSEYQMHDSVVQLKRNHQPPCEGQHPCFSPTENTTLGAREAVDQTSLTLAPAPMKLPAPNTSATMSLDPDLVFTTAALAEPDFMLYGWTDSNFDSQALQMDFVFPEFEGLDEWQNDFLGFDIFDKP